MCPETEYAVSTFSVYLMELLRLLSSLFNLIFPLTRRISVRLLIDIEKSRLYSSAFPSTSITSDFSEPKTHEQTR